MPIYRCSKCGCGDNTALTYYWIDKADDKPLLCSACDPRIGKWHGRFPKTTLDENRLGPDGFRIEQQ